MARTPRKSATKIDEATANQTLQQRRELVRQKMDAFCDAHLDTEYKEACRKLLEKITGNSESGFDRGKPEVWAGGIVHAIGSYNFLFDRSTDPYISAADLAAAFGASQAAVSQRASAIRQQYHLQLPNREFALGPMVGLLDQMGGMLSELGLLMNEENGTISIAVGGDGQAQIDSFRVNPNSRRANEFVDDDRMVMHEFYDLMEASQNLSAQKVADILEQFIAADPDFCDTYLALAELWEENGDTERPHVLREIAYQRAMQRLTGKDGKLPERVEWGWLENRHLLRAIMAFAMDRWEAGNNTAALEALRFLLRINPGDNQGARYYILAIRQGNTLEEYESRFEVESGYLDALKIMTWFDNDSAQYPDEFAVWAEQMKQNE